MLVCVEEIVFTVWGWVLRRRAKVGSSSWHVISVFTATDLLEAGLVNTGRIRKRLARWTYRYREMRSLEQLSHALSLLPFSKKNSLWNITNVVLNNWHIYFLAGRAIIANFTAARAHNISFVCSLLMSKHLTFETTKRIRGIRLDREAIIPTFGGWWYFSSIES